MTAATWPDLAYWREQAQRLERELEEARQVIATLQAELVLREGSMARPSSFSEPVVITAAEPNAPR